MKNLIVLMTLFTCSSLYAQDGAYKLTIQVENIKSMEGEIKIGIFADGETFLKKAVTGAKVKADKTQLAYVFEGLADGEYAVSVYHDENENGELDSNILGIPTEPYAFSNNARGTFGPPDFDACKFEIDGTHKSITIKL